MTLYKLNDMRALNKLSFLLVTFMLISGFANAQPPGKDRADRKEKIEQLKIAFITKELELTTDEAEKFWPIYNEMSDKLHENKKEERTLQKELKENFDTLSEEEIKTKSQAILDKDIEQAELKKEYHEKIAGVIGYKKATKLLSLEQQFKRELLQHVKGRQEPPHGKPAPKPAD